MRYLSLALFAEGKTDHRFLSSVLQRLAADVCLRNANAIIDVGPFVSLTTPERSRGASRSERILAAASDADNAYHVLFIHTDGAGDHDRAFAERVGPAAEEIAARLSDGDRRTVGVVPVRETEAWALADGDAVRAAFGTGLPNDALGIPARPQDVEGVAHLKQVLQRALDLVMGAGRRRKQASDFLESIGERTQLDQLREVPAFRRMEDRLRLVLQQLGFFGV